MLKRSFKIIFWIVLGLIAAFVVFIIVASVARRSTYTDRATLLPTTAQGYGMVASEDGAPGVMNYVSMRKEATGVVTGARGDKENAADRLIIKTSVLSMAVKDVPMAVKAITDYAAAHGGFVVSTNVYKSGLAPYAEVVVRIAAKDFDAGVQEVKSMGEVTSARVDGQDVTEEYTDLNSQLRNLQATELQLLDIMKRSGTIPDVLAVQRELTVVRQQIEQLQGRMKYLKQSAELSTLTVNLSTDPNELPVVDRETDKWKPVAIFKEAVRSLIEVGKTLGNTAIWVIIFTPVWLGVVLILWLVIKVVKHWWK